MGLLKNMAQGATIASPIADFIGGLTTNAANKQIAKDNRDFQERMSNTAHQREMQDLLKAGINPIYGISKGSGGASTPTPNTPTMQNPLAGFANSAFQAASITSEIAKIKADKNLSESLANKADEEAETQQTVRDMNSASAGKHIQETLESKARIRKVDREIDRITKEMENIDAQKNYTKTQNERETLRLKREKLHNELYDILDSARSIIAPNRQEWEAKQLEHKIKRAENQAKKQGKKATNALRKQVKINNNK
jgi:uncharacterized protein YdcH (DUF465 family)